MNGKNTIDNENFETHFISTYENGYLPVGWNDMFTLPSGEEVYCFSIVREALELWKNK